MRQIIKVPNTAFIDLLKVYDRIYIDKLWEVTEVLRGKLLVTIQSLYEDGWQE